MELCIHFYKDTLVTCFAGSTLGESETSGCLVDKEGMDPYSTLHSVGPLRRALSLLGCVLRTLSVHAVDILYDRDHNMKDLHEGFMVLA